MATALSSRSCSRAAVSWLLLAAASLASSGAALKRVGQHEAPAAGGVKNHIAMLMAPGCSGSSFVWTELIELMRLHGVYAWTPGKEWLHPDKNFFDSHRVMCTDTNGTDHIWPEGPFKRLKLAQQVLDREIRCQEDFVKGPTGHVMLIVANVHTELDTYKRVFDLLRRTDGSFAGMFRANRLDSHICFAKDCFMAGMGKATYPVLNGKKNTEMCFQRRKMLSHGDVYQVHLNPSEIIRELQVVQSPWWLSERPGWEPLRREFGIHGMPQFSYEDLTAYEYGGENSLNRSVDAFAQLLSGLGVPAERAILERRFRDWQATHELRNRTSHAVEVTNADQIRRKLRSSKDHAWMWRGA